MCVCVCVLDVVLAVKDKIEVRRRRSSIFLNSDWTSTGLIRTNVIQGHAQKPVVGEMLIV